jgi:hypothetical protein
MGHRHFWKLSQDIQRLNTLELKVSLLCSQEPIIRLNSVSHKSRLFVAFRNMLINFVSEIVIPTPKPLFVGSLMLLIQHIICNSLSWSLFSSCFIIHVQVPVRLRIYIVWSTIGWLAYASNIRILSSEF